MSVAMLFLITSTQLGLPPGLLSSICMVESGHKVNAMHHHDGNGNSVGICQIKLQSAQLMGFKGTEKQLMDPKTNITFAGKYLKHQITRYNGDVTKAVIAYNQGSAKNLTTTKYNDKVTLTWRGRYVCAKSR